MRLQKIHFLGISIAVLFLLISIVPSESFATSVIYEDIDGFFIVNFRDIDNKGSAADVEDAVITLDKEEYEEGDTAVITITDANADVSSKVDFIFATVSGSSLSLTETDTNSGNFTRSVTVGDVLEVSYTPDAKTAARAKITLPAFSGDLVFSDFIEDPNKIDNECILPVTGTLKITGDLDVQPTIRISYANANFTGFDFDETDLNMFYRAPGQQAEIITDIKAKAAGDFIDEFKKVIRSQNGGSVVSPGGWVPTPTNYAGQYFLGWAPESCPGGGGGGLVRPSLVVNALAGIGGGAGGGSAYSSPALQLSNLVLLDWIDVPLEVEETVVNHDSSNPATPYDLGYFEDFDYPLVINDKGFILSGFTTTLETQTLKINTPHTIKFLFYESEIIQHFSLYTNLRDTTDEIHESDTQILYNANQELRVVDPNGFFESVSLTVNELEDNKKQVVLEIIFANTMDTSHIIVRSWDPNLYSADNHILDAWEIVSDEIIESPITTTVEPEIQELKSQSIPIWIKNNAAWWSDQQISDSDFVAGIEYLIKNKIINVPGVEVGASSASSEIPEWIKNNAGWWANSLITDEDFTEAMQWLVANGVIQI